MEYDALKQPDRITHEYNMLMSSMARQRGETFA